ncbi:bifunctional ADP-dependent NAD(P)H-hydrate dehydratase/NAD(P)H-hydrate epimerase [Luteococcus sp. OSA5]|uniref:bifunctional ADP-dependent NAD(P)H-hydrate dehydratase/NAD(P)H-hydrate epimerase n=1 Tax=Luteococcus sp. OSA5 TaxID=3401630 RepID=UPI003B436532
MIPVHNAQQVRDAEAVFMARNPDVDLMQIAADGVAETALAMLGDRGEATRFVLVAAGTGNNGGDGLFAAARLAREGCQVAIWLTGGSGHPDGLKAATEAGCQVVDCVTAAAQLAEVDLLIDAVAGIGGRHGLEPAVATFAAEAHMLEVDVLSVDVPSGIAADSSVLPEDCFRATRTITFATRKPCHVLKPAASASGVVETFDIGLELPRPVVWQAQVGDVARRWPLPGPTSDKYSRGVVGIDTGSARYPGAAVLGTIGALHAGAGMIRFVGPEAAANLIRTTLPSVTHGEGAVQAWLVGSGWGQTEANRERLAARLAAGKVPAVIDADALVMLPETLPTNCLLTPHAGELSRMLGVERSIVEADPVRHGRMAAERWDSVVLLKGATQYVVTPDGQITLAVPGPYWSAQAGSGDVLAGICATLLASGLSAADAALLGASVQAMAAQRRRGPFPPDVIAREVATIVGEFDFIA